MRAEGVGGFVGRTALWLPACVAAWYWTAPWHARVVGAIAEMGIGIAKPRLLSAVEAEGTRLDFVTTITSYVDGRQAVLVPDVNPLIYTYGLPFLVALMLASRSKAWKVAVAAIALLPFQAWGVAFDFLAQVAVRLGPEVSARAGFSDFSREAIALGFQIGSLILPTLVPVALWAAFNRPFFEKLRSRPATTQPA